MALYTTLSGSRIAAVLKRFPALPDAPFTYEGVALGTVNTYYRIVYRNGETHYLKIDEVADEKRLKNEIRIFEHLARYAQRLAHKTPLPLPSDLGNRYVPLDGKFALVVPELPGRSYFGKDLTPARLGQIGRHIRSWHDLPVDRRIPEHRFNWRGQKGVFREIRTALALKHPELERDVARRLKDFARKAPRREGLRLIHADLFPENIMWAGNRLNGILDFDAAGLGAPLFDVGVCLHALCHDGKAFDRAKIKGFLKGYFKDRGPTRFDRTLFPYYLDLSAMRFLLTRLRDFELAPGPVKAEPFKDYGEFARRFVENKDLRELI
jgi:homoserine kinase type II